MKVPPGIATNPDWVVGAVVMAVVDAGYVVAVEVVEVAAIEGTVVVVVVVAGAVVGVLTDGLTVMVLVTVEAVVPVFVALVAVFLQDGAKPIDARVMPPITTPAFSKNSLRFRAFRGLFFSLCISFTSIAGLVSARFCNQ